MRHTLFLALCWLLLSGMLVEAASIDLRIELDDSSQQIKVGDEFLLKVTAGPSGTRILSATAVFSSGNENIEFVNDPSLTTSGTLFTPLDLNQIVSGEWVMSGTSSSGSAVTVGTANARLGKIKVRAKASGPVMLQLNTAASEFSESLRAQHTVNPIQQDTITIGGAAPPPPPPPPASDLPLTLTSSAFSNNGVIPGKYTCTDYNREEGTGMNPPLTISNIPAGTESMVLIMDDLDAVTGQNEFVHWVIWNIPVSGNSAVITENTIPAGAFQGDNGYSQQRYAGPCPPTDGRVHHYRFRVYALDATASELLTTASSLSKSGLLFEMGVTDEQTNTFQPPVLGMAQLTGQYSILITDEELPAEPVEPSPPPPTPPPILPATEESGECSSDNQCGGGLHCIAGKCNSILLKIKDILNNMGNRYPTALQKVSAIAGVLKEYFTGASRIVP